MILLKIKFYSILILVDNLLILCPSEFLDMMLLKSSFLFFNGWLPCLQESHSPFPFIHVPKVFRYLSRKRVLTMEWMVGESPTDLISLSTGSSVDGSSTHLDRQKLDAKWRLLDLVCKNELHSSSDVFTHIALSRNF